MSAMTADNGQQGSQLGTNKYRKARSEYTEMHHRRKLVKQAHSRSSSDARTEREHTTSHSSRSIIRRDCQSATAYLIRPSMRLHQILKASASVVQTKGGDQRLIAIWGTPIGVRVQAQGRKLWAAQGWFTRIPIRSGRCGTTGTDRDRQPHLPPAE